MPLRSVIDVDVNDDSFRAFQTLFEKYNSVLEKMPAQWNKINTSQQQTRNGFVEIASALLTQQEMLRRSEREVEKIDRAVISTGRSMQGLARSTREFSGHLMSATTTIMKWTGLAGVIGTLVGYLSAEGITHLAGAGARMYRGAAGYAGPTTAAQVGAAGAYSGVLDPRATLAQLTEMIQTGEGKRGLVALGFGPNDWSRGAGALMPEFLRRLQRTSKSILSTNEGNYGDIMEGYGLGGFTQTGRVLGRMTPEQLEEIERLRIKNETELNRLTDDLLMKWVKLSGIIDLAGTKIEAAFVTALSNLAPEIGRFTEAFSTAVIRLGSSEQVKEWMDKLSDGLKKVDIETFATRVGEGAEKLVSLASALTSLIGKIGNVMGWIDNNTSLGADTMKGDVQRGMLGWGAAGAFIGNMIAGPRGAAIGGGLGAAAGGVASMFTSQPRSKWSGPLPEGKAPPGQSFNPSNYSGGQVDPSLLTGIQFFEERGLTREQAIGVVARLASESGGGVRLDPNAELKDGSGTAYGVAQWRGPRQPAARATNGQLIPQLWLVWNEMQVPGTREAEALKLIQNSHNSPDSARNMELYERAGNPTFTELAATRAAGLSGKLPASGPLSPSTAAPSTSAPAASVTGRTPEQVKQLLAKYSTAEMMVYRRRGSLDRDGVPVLPPGLPISSTGDIYSPTFKSMTDAERNTEKLHSADWKAANQNRDPSQLYQNKAHWPTLQGGSDTDVTIRKPSGVRVTVEHDVGGGAPSGAAQVAQ